jgi:hypothetical protein
MLIPLQPKRPEVRCLDLKRVAAVARPHSAVAVAEDNLAAVVEEINALYKGLYSRLVAPML